MKYFEEQIGILFGLSGRQEGWSMMGADNVMEGAGP
jgi:hypothetical protein